MAGARATDELRLALPEIAAFCTSARKPWAPALLEHLQRTLRATEGRRAAALRRTRERSAAVRAGIRQAIGALPVEAWGVAGVVQRRIGLKGPARYGLRNVPDLETIRAVLKSLRVSEPEPAPTPDDRE